MCGSQQAIVSRRVNCPFYEEEKNPHYCSLLNVAGVTSQVTCSEEANNVIWITRIEEVRFHFGLDLFRHFENKA